MTIPNKIFANGVSIPSVGLGTYKEEKETVLIDAVKAAIKAGYRHFDCAYIYFNEQHIGRAIRESIAESNGQLKREDFFIVSKLWNTFHSKERVEVCLDDILGKLGLEYLDCFLIHWPMGFAENEGDYPTDENGKMKPSDVHYLDTYRQMEEMVRKGKTKHIGVSNFNVKQVQDVLNICQIKPICNQFEVNPLLHNNELVKFCQDNDIAVVAYAPLGAPDRSWLKSEDPVPLQHPSILELAAKYKKTPAQVILRWLIQRDIIVIPKSVTPARIAENADIFDFTLNEQDVQVFNTFSQFRFYSFDVSNNHPFYPFQV